MQVQKQNQKAITLIALVITVIILLILTGVTISTLDGENGLIAKVEKAKIEQMKAEAKENINLAIMEIQMNEKEKQTTLQVLHDKLPSVDNRIEVEDYTSGDKILHGIYNAGNKKFEFIIDEQLNVIIGEEAKEKEKGFEITVTDIEKTSLRVTGNAEEISTIGATEFTYVAATTGSEIKYEHITDTSYVVTGLEPETEYTVYMIAYDNAGNERKSNAETVTTKSLEIQVSDIIIAETTTSKKSVDDNSIVRGNTLYINFNATLEGTACTIVNKDDGKAVPYEITEDGTYTFIVTGTYDGKTKTKEVSVTTNKYKTYKIYTADDLQNMENDLAGYYTVMNNIDMTGFDFQTIDGDFTGTLDGQGHTISNLTITNTIEGSSGHYTGIFEGVNSGATIENILFKDVNISSASAYVGVLAGCVSRDVDVKKVGITGNISGNNRVGSFFGTGYSDSRIPNFENCYAKTTLTSTNGYNAGGFIGGNSGFIKFTNSYWSGSTNATKYVGTFKGNYSGNNQNVENNTPILTNCYYNKELFTLSVPEEVSGIGLTTDQFANSSNFTGWDFKENDADTEYTWYIGADGYPELHF